MRFFNIDLHVSVISDVAANIHYLGHSVEENCMSGHWWALNKPRGYRGTSPGPNGRVGYGPINLATWEGIFWRPVLPDDTMDVTEEVARKCPELADFDGFICCYPPSFAYLYGKFGKPIIVDVPVRYEWPFTQNVDHWNRWNRYLAAGQDSGQIRLVGNSVYECRYYEYFTGRKMTYISSTCEYIDRFAPKYAMVRNHQDVVWAMGEHAGCREAAANVPGVQFIRDAKPQYMHTDIPQAKAVVWIPYNCSIMSFFEHYWLNIPIFVPSEKFLLELYARKAAMSQFSWNYDHTGSLLPRVGTDLPDPNLREGVPAWLPFYDFYNRDEHPHVVYFDSWADLKALLETTDLNLVSGKMTAHNIMRKERNIGEWKKIIGG